MRLPVIKHINEFVKNHDEDYVEEAIALLEDLTELPSIRDEELDVIGELLSNMYGTLEVRKMMEDDNLSEKEALNAFMKRVTGSIEK